MKVQAASSSLGEILDRLVDRAAQDQPASFVDLVREAGLDPAHDFVGASLSDVDLRGEDLRGFDFTDADLTGADLRGAELEGVRFTGAVLTGAVGLPDTPIPTGTPYDLGPFQGLIGTWAGTGFDFNWQQIRTPGPGNVPVSATSDNLLELHSTAETLEFTPIPGELTVRGFIQRSKSFGVEYHQAIRDASDDKELHREAGYWAIMWQTSRPAQPTVVRILDRKTINALGRFFTANGPPNITAVYITPFEIGQPNNKVNFPSQTLTVQSTARIPQDLTSFAAGRITQSVLSDPNTILREYIAGQKITSTITMAISTQLPATLFGARTDSIVFLLSDPAASLRGFMADGEARPKTAPVQMQAVFWIETVEHTILVPIFKPGQPPLVIEAVAEKAGEPVPRFQVTPTVEITQPREITVRSTQIQYSQTLLLNFNGLSWPHVSVATLVPANPVLVPWN